MDAGAKRRIIVAVGVIAVIALALLVVRPSYFPSTPSSSTSTSQPTTATCSGVPSEPLFLTVRNSSTGSPIPGLPVRVEDSYPANPCSPAGSHYDRNLGVLNTDYNGTVQLCCTGSTFFFSVPIPNGNYAFNSTAEGTTSAQCVTLYIPSEVTNTTFAPTNQQSC